jgi:extracellular factor (EF) 3-hydroxypalmitic acid methyl ester biosynthesis protein
VLTPYYQKLKSLAQKGGPDPDDYEDTQAFFSEVMGVIRSTEDADDHLDFFYKNIGELLLCETGMMGFTVLKPHGYAGDFEMIDRIYQRWTSPKQELKKWDVFFQSQKACVAVRNRKDFFIELVHKLHDSSEDESFNILNVGSGPGRDVYALLEKNKLNVSIDCIDQDEKAILYDKNLCEKFSDSVTFYKKNIFHYRTSNRYDLIWSAGLFDYLDDRLFRILLKKLYKLIKPGGRLVVGNFSPINPSRDFMEFGKWYLHHRSEDELLLLADGVAEENCEVIIEKEKEGINLFLTIEK